MKSLTVDVEQTTQNLVHQFEQDGYLILREFAPDSLVDKMLNSVHEDLDRGREPIEYEVDVQYPGSPESIDAPGGKTVRRLRQVLSRDPSFQEWITYPPLVQQLSSILGSPVTCPLAHHNCVMTKHPRYSSDTGWHRDTRFWSFQNGELVNAWLALGQERIENGCLKVIPGSHRLTSVANRLDENQFLDHSLAVNQPLFETVQTVELNKGDLLLFHAMLFHAASRNHTDQTKYSAVFTFHGPENSPLPGSKSASYPEMILPLD